MTIEVTREHMETILYVLGSAEAALMERIEREPYLQNELRRVVEARSAIIDLSDFTARP